MIRSHSANKTLHLGLLIGLGLIFFIFETLVPHPLPWFKPGLANLVTVIALYRYNARAAILVTCSRVFLGSLIVGSFFSPAFWLSLAAGVGSAAAMALVLANNRFQFSVIGVSLWGSVTHNIIQLMMAYWLIAHHLQIFRLLPLLIFPALFTGPMVGFLALLILQKWDQATRW